MSKKMEQKMCALFQGTYHNRWKCVLPHQYLGDHVTEQIPSTFFHPNHVVLAAPLSHKDAILCFMQLFPHSTRKEQTAFMKSGYGMIKLARLDFAQIQK